MPIIDTTLHDQWREVQRRFAAEEAAAEDARVAAAAAAQAATPDRATDAAGRPLRHDGWTPERQQTFLTAIAQGLTVENACRLVGLSTTSAYAFRGRAAGAAFALGWSAANLLAREPLADGLLARALDGQVEWYTRADGRQVERFRYDNGLATRMLARLDRQADAEGSVTGAAARLIAGEFEAYLAQLGRDEGPARAALFLAARGESGGAAADLDPVRTLARADRFARAGGGLPGEVDASDLDLAARASWTGEQWLRAEAAGLLLVAPEPAGESMPEAQPDLAPTACEPQLPQLVTSAVQDTPIWWDEDAQDWRTCFPAPADFDGEETGCSGADGYQRELSPEEWLIVQRNYDAELAEGRAMAVTERDRWLAEAAARVGLPAPHDQRTAHASPPVDRPADAAQAMPEPAAAAPPVHEGPRSQPGEERLLGNAGEVETLTAPSQERAELG